MYKTDLHYCRKFEKDLQQLTKLKEVQRKSNVILNDDNNEINFGGGDLNSIAN